MPFSQDLSKAFQTGITPEAHRAALKRIAPALQRLRREKREGTLALLGLPAERGDLSAIKAAARTFKKGARDVLVLGTGGSSLGGQTLAQLAGYGTPGAAVLAKKPRLHFIDNLDPLTFEALLAGLELSRTKFLCISKSGGTGETLMQAIAAISALEKAGRGKMLSTHFLGVSEPEKPGGKNALRALLAPYGVTFLDHHTGVGGRYSVLSNTGLLPAAILGLDIRAIRKGAGEALKQSLISDPAQSPAALGAALQLAAMDSGKGITIVMPYTDRLERFTKWFVQLWAESLGKDGKGTLPAGAVGPVDQHSAQQLFLAGPRDKLFTVLTVETKGLGPVMDKALSARAGEPGFAGKTIGDLVAAQSRAMIDTFAKNSCPVRRIHLERLDEASLGALLMHFMLETILTGYAMGVDPFDQPAVEEAKILAKRYLADGG